MSNTYQPTPAFWKEAIKAERACYDSGVRHGLFNSTSKKAWIGDLAAKHIAPVMYEGYGSFLPWRLLADATLRFNEPTITVDHDYSQWALVNICLHRHSESIEIVERRHLELRRANEQECELVLEELRRGASGEFDIDISYLKSDGPDES